MGIKTQYTRADVALQIRDVEQELHNARAALARAQGRIDRAVRLIAVLQDYASIADACNR